MTFWDLPDIKVPDIVYKNPSPFDDEATRRLVESSMDMRERLKKTLNEINNQRIGVSDPWRVHGIHPVLMVGLVVMLVVGVIRLCMLCCRCSKQPSQEIHVPAPTPAPASDPVTAPVSAPAGYVVLPPDPPSYNAPPCPPAYDCVRLLPGPD